MRPPALSEPRPWERQNNPISVDRQSLEWSELYARIPSRTETTMSLWRPDPTFYPSPKLAMQAPPEKLAYVAMLNANGKLRPDALGVVDVDPQSTGYGR